MSSAPTTRVLVIEDDRDFADLVKLNLEQGGYRVHVDHNGDAGLRSFESIRYDLVLLDWMLPGTDGTDICRRIRTTKEYTPIMMLTARDSEVDRILGLEFGADDYLTKPVSMREMIARVRALMRRAEAMKQPGQQELLERGVLRIDSTKRQATCSGAALVLTAKEFDLLTHFASRPGVVFTRQQLLENVWGYRFEGYEHTVNSHINRLRTKLRACKGGEGLIETVWGVGYRFREVGV